MSEPRLKELRERVERAETEPDYDHDIQGWYAEDVPWLLAKVERYRKALEQIADDGVEGYESPQKRVALAALGQKGEQA